MNSDFKNKKYKYKKLLILQITLNQGFQIK
jgi:hypothetical protein